MRAPTKAELYAQVKALQKEVERLRALLEADKRAVWEKKIPLAAEIFHRQVNELYPRAVKNATFHRVDASGYHFSYELTNNDRRQMLVVYHCEVGTELINRENDHERSIQI